MSLDDFNLAFKDNRDGVGYAWFKDGQAHFKKGLMGAQEAWDFGKTLELPFTIHFRSASAGMPKVPELTHPFIISWKSPLDLEGAANSLLFHNGTEYNYKTLAAAAGIYPATDELTSDSHCIAKIISQNNERFLEVLGSKFVIADAARNEFFYYGHFTNLNGILYSNLAWKVVIHHSKKKTQTQIVTMPNVSPDVFSRPKPWENFDLYLSEDKDERGTLFSRSIVLRYLLGKITPKAANKLWNKYTRGRSKKNKMTIEKAQDCALKIYTQQKPDANISGLLKFIERQKLHSAQNTENTENERVIIHHA